MNTRMKALLAAAGAAAVVAPIGALASAQASTTAAPLSAVAEASTDVGGIHDEDPGFDAGVAQVTRELAADPSARAAAERAVGVDIKVYYKVFYDRQTGKGKLTYEQALNQTKWLNHSYSGGQGGVATRFDFVLGGYKNIAVDSRRVNLDNTTAGNGATYVSERTKSLMRNHHDGGAATLNVYVADLVGDGVDGPQGNGLIGKSTFPQYAKAHPNVDGVWYDRGAIRGTAGDGTSRNSTGDVLVHEVGHWIGALAHTDTSGACRANFMSYASDACMTSFTSGQADRMSSAWTRYRD